MTSWTKAAPLPSEEAEKRIVSQRRCAQERSTARSFPRVLEWFPQDFVNLDVQSVLWLPHRRDAARCMVEPETFPFRCFSLDGEAVPLPCGRKKIAARVIFRPLAISPLARPDGDRSGFFSPVAP
jgi:hypothetical protein